MTHLNIHEDPFLIHSRYLGCPTRMPTMATMPTSLSLVDKDTPEFPSDVAEEWAFLFIFGTRGNRTRPDLTCLGLTQTYQCRREKHATFNHHWRV